MSILNERQLRRIINEEINNILNEDDKSFEDIELLDFRSVEEMVDSLKVDVEYKITLFKYESIAIRHSQGLGYYWEIRSNVKRSGSMEYISSTSRPGISRYFRTEKAAKEHLIKNIPVAFKDYYDDRSVYLKSVRSSMY